MKRRDFIWISTLAAGGLSLRSPLNISSTFVRKSVSWKIYEDGSYDILTDGLSLLKCYPSMDDRPVSPKNFRIEKNKAGLGLVYELLEGSLELIMKKDDDSVFIETILSGMKTAPLSVNPVGNAQIKGGAKFFKQGLGFGGPSGMFDFTASRKQTNAIHLSEQSWSYDSYLCSAIIANNGNTMAIGAYEHNQYLQRTSFFNNVHRQGLTDENVEMNEKFLINAGFLTENIPMPADGLKLTGIHIISGTQPFATLQQLAQNIAQVSKARTNKPAMYYWDSWYEYREDFDSRKLDDLLGGLVTLQPKMPIKAITIDAGFCPMGDWLNADSRMYPNGLEAEVKKILDAGYKAGLYMGPFMVSSKSKLYKGHPDWVLKGLDGQPLLVSKGSKGMIDNLVANEERYYLDTSHPEAFEYLRNAFRTYKSWGAYFYKIDFLEWGLRNSAEVKRYTPGKTSVQYFRDVVEMIRQEVGDDSYILGCISPFAPMIGIADGMRIAYDTHYCWDSDGPTQNVLNELIADQYFNNIFWQNDPDAMHLRHAHSNQFTDEEVKSLFYLFNMTGSIISTSDRFHMLQDYRLKLWRFVQPANKVNTGQFPFWNDKNKKFQYIVKSFDNGSFALLVLNICKEEKEESVQVSDLTGEKELNCFDWEPGKFSSLGLKSIISCKLKAHESRLVYLSKNKVAPAAGMGLSGDVVEGL